MAQYDITAPDGTHYQVTAPDDATQAQVMAYVQSQHVAPTAPPAAPNARASAVNSVQASQLTPDQKNLLIAGMRGFTPQARPDISTVGAMGGPVVPLNAQPAPGAPNMLVPEQPFPNAKGLGGAVLNQSANAVNAASQHVGQQVLGVGQLALHGANAITGGALQSPTSAFDRYITQQHQQYEDTQPNGIGTDIGAGVGEVLPWLAGDGELRALGALPKVTSTAGKLGALAGAGALMGATQPVFGNDFAAQKALQVGGGALTAGGLGGIGGGVSKALPFVQNTMRLFSPGGRAMLADARLAKYVQGAPGNVADQLGAAAPFVPGEVPTIAQAAPSPEMLQVERTLRTNPTTQLPFVNTDIANDAARTKVLKDLGGSDPELRDAIRTRDANAYPFSQANLGSALPADRWGAALGELNNVRGRLSGSDFDALKGAAGIMRKVMQPSSGLQEDDALSALHELGDSVTSQSAQDAFQRAYSAIDAHTTDPQPILDAINQSKLTRLGALPATRGALDTIANDIQSAKLATGRVPNDFLHGVRMSLRKRLVAANNGQSVGPSEIAGLEHLKSTLGQTLDRSAPGYLDFLAQYARDSAPINQMEAARAALGDLGDRGLNAGGGVRLTLPAINKALDHADQSEFGMAPAARARLEGIKNSLQRQSISDNKIGTKASDTAANNRLAKIAMNPWTARLAGSAIGGGIGGFRDGPEGSALGAAAGFAVPFALGRYLMPRLGEVDALTAQRAASAPLAAAALRRAGAARLAPMPLGRLLSPALPYTALPASQR